MSKTLVITKDYNEATMSYRYQATVTLELFQPAEVEAAVAVDGFEVEDAIANIILKRMKREIQEFDEIRIERIPHDRS